MFRIFIFLFVVGCSFPLLQAATPNRLSEQEQKQGFQLLFNGKDFDGWENVGNWKIVDQAIHHTGHRGKSLILKSHQIPEDFELRFEWKVAKASNSGIIYFRKRRFEYQILDNKKKQ